MIPKRTLLAQAGILALLCAADFASKWAAELFIKGKGTIRLIGDFLVFVYAENGGAFLGLGSGFHPVLWIALFVALPLGVVVWVIVEIIRGKPANAMARWGYLLVAAGGLCNLADRVFRGGFVRDFINAGIGSLRTGVLNVADLYITIGVVLILFATGRAEPVAP